GEARVRVVVVVADGVDVPARHQELRAVGGPAGGGRDAADHRVAQGDGGPPQDVGAGLQVGPGQRGGVDGGAEPAVGGELGGGQLDGVLAAAAAEGQPQPAVLAVLVGHQDLLEDPEVEVANLGRGRGRVEAVKLGVRGAGDGEELGAVGRGVA